MAQSHKSKEVNVSSANMAQSHKSKEVLAVLFMRLRKIKSLLLFLNYYNPKKSFGAFLVALRSVAGPHPFFDKKAKLGIFSKFFKNQVAND